MGNDNPITWFILFVLIKCLIQEALLLPVSQQQYCPVINESDMDPTIRPSMLGSNSKVIRMEEVEGNKVRLQFYYPSANRRHQINPSSSVTSGETTSTSILGSRENRDDSTTQIQPEGDDDGTTIIPSTQLDIFCQWDFRASNDSQFLLLTFEKLSAPYSDNCAEAFVAMQKENGYESRWCGNRKQKANAKTMSLFSRGSAKVSIYRSATAPPLPSTGFTVVVESVDVNTFQGGKNTLRVLLG